jgi:hypothetical protein
MSLPSVGVRAGQTIARSKKFWEEYDALPKNLAREVAAYESGPRYKSSGAQTQDQFLKLREENTAARRQYRLDHQAELLQDRTGRILHMNQFLLMLRQAGVKARYAPKGAFPGMLGLWVNHNDVDQYICFVHVPYMQEYEELYFDEYDVPLGPKRRGWRTVLLRLMIAGVLTEDAAHEVFGAPPQNGVSRRYWAELQALRQAKI